MRRGRMPLGCVVVLLGCGAEAPAPADIPIAPMERAAVAADAAVLVPRDAACVVRISSAGRLQAMARRLAADAGLALPAEPLDLLCSLVGLDAADIDRGRPLFLCLSPGPEDGPALTLVAPMRRDPGAARTAPAAATYVAKSRGPAPATGGSPLVEGLVEGDVSLRADVPRLLAMRPPDFENWVVLLLAGNLRADARGPDMRSLARGIAEALRERAEEAETLDLALREHDGALDLQMALNSNANDPADRDSHLADLARHLPPDAPIVVLWRGDWSRWEQLALPVSELMERLPAADRDALRNLSQGSAGVSACLRDEWAAGLGFSGGGPRMTLATAATDPDGFVAMYPGLLTDPAMCLTGLKFRDEGTRVAAGTTVQALRLSLDVRAYLAFLGRYAPPRDALESYATAFGEDGLRIELASRGDRVLVTAGDGGLMEAALGGRGPPPWFGPVTRGIRGELTFLCRIDLRALQRGVADMMHVPRPVTAPAGAAAPVVFWVAREHGVTRIGLTLRPGEVVPLLPMTGPR